MNEISEISIKPINKPRAVKNYKLIRNKIIAMVPVRAGSTRVLNKTLANLLIQVY